jgi:molybdopterin molybdotransferase
MSDSCFNSPGLVSVDEAIAFLVEQARPATQTETVSLKDALGRVLAQPVISSVNVPPADNTAMDGYAVAFGDLNAEGETVLPVSQRIVAGETGVALQSGTAARIFTGAPIPRDADTVIMQEQCAEQADGSIRISGKVKQGDHIRRAGEDIRINDEVLTVGRLLQPQDLGLAASVGCATLTVYNPLRVAIFSTGDELVEPGEEAGEGKIYNSNRYTLSGLLHNSGCEVVDLGVVEDTLEATIHAMQHAAEMADLVMTTGGVSVGEEDYVRLAIEQLGEIGMWRVAMKPGKPFAYGRIADTPFIGLPGNPVSVFATYCLFARPWILRSQGMQDVLPQPVTIPAGFDWPKKGPRREYIRVRLQTDDRGICVVPFKHQGSGVLTSVSWAHGLVEIRENTTVSRGEPVNFLPFHGLLG